ncbi:MAG: hypothetical protein H8E66_17335 [Planctomycetes bacterium]|nr:hypothetical protein [Planctomycetota bacterium]
MADARLTFIGVATATLLLTGCAGPAWFAQGKLSEIGKRRSRAQREEGATNASQTTASSVRELGAAPSLSQVLDDVERIKDRSLSDFAVIQSAVEDASSDFPPQYQQTYKDQMRGLELQQQGQDSQSFADPSGVIDSQLYQAPAVQTPTEQISSLAYPDVQSMPQASVPAGVAPAAHSVGLGPAAPLRSSVGGVPPVGMTTHIGDAQSSQVAPVGQSNSTSLEAPANETGAEVAQELEIEPGQWRRELENALASLNADLARPNLERDERAKLEILRRLLYVATNQRDEAVAPVDQLDEDEREYWKHQIHGLLVSIDADGKHPTTRRAALALRNLRTAVDHLANLSTLDVRNVNFCKEALSYGEYRLFDSYTFRAKDEVVLYVEVDNFATHPRSDSFETELHSSYEIIDDAGRRVANVVLPADKQVSRNRRRDYFIAHLIQMPTQIASGSYRLRLTIEDVIGKKSNHAAVDFRIK